MFYMSHMKVVTVVKLAILLTVDSMVSVVTVVTVVTKHLLSTAKKNSPTISFFFIKNFFSSNNLFNLNKKLLRKLKKLTSDQIYFWTKLKEIIW